MLDKLRVLTILSPFEKNNMNNLFLFSYVDKKNEIH